MRIDGRAWNEMRPVRMTPGFTNYAEGSVLIEMGDTRVLCNATLQDSVPSWRFGSGAGWLTAEYALLPRSTHQRTQRETQALSGRTQEIRRLIGRSLRTVVDFAKLGERTIILDCDVIQADGGTRAASITGGYVALALAVQRLVEEGDVSPSVMSGEVAAISLGLVDGRLLLDLRYQEDHTAGADFNVVMTGNGKLIEVQGTSEGTLFDRAALDAMLDLAEQGIDQLLAMQRQVIQDAAGVAA
jgi:ribonuclease PH